jgi:hypothetical protein
MHKKNFQTLSLVFFVLVGNTMAQQSISIEPDFSDSTKVFQWEFNGSGLWKISDGKLIIYKAGIAAGPIRKPSALAILKSKPFKTVTLESEIKSNAPDSTIRKDIDIVVGYQSPTRFYYIHLSGISDDVHNGIFLVDNSDRRRIDSGRSQPQLKDRKWHFVKVKRDGKSGKIEVYVDRSIKPALEAKDTTISYGLVGVGSFDDTGEFRNILIIGVLK